MIVRYRTIIVHDSAYEAITFEHRKRLECFAPAHHVRAFHILAAREHVVQLAACPVIRHLPVPWHRQTRRDRMA